MLFNSFFHAIFLPIVFILYWFVFLIKILKQQKFFNSCCKLFFLRVLGLEIFIVNSFSSIVDYTIGLKLNAQKRKLIVRYYYSQVS